MKNNVPKNTSNYTKDFFKKRYNLLDWPSQSPDLNPIEHLWDHVKREVRKRKPATKKQLEDVICGIWHEITPEMCVRLVSTMPNRCGEVVRNKGEHHFN